MQKRNQNQWRPTDTPGERANAIATLLDYEVPRAVTNAIVDVLTVLDSIGVGVVADNAEGGDSMVDDLKGHRSALALFDTCLKLLL